MDNRKEIKMNYKNTPPGRGVVVIRNLENKKLFITSSPNAGGILSRYKTELKLGSHRNKILQRDFNEFGPQNFSFEVVELLKNQDDPDYNYKEELQILEEIWREKLNLNADNGYNWISRS